MSTSTSIQEKRKTHRCACILEAKVAGGTDSYDPAWRARAVNISSSGVGMHSDIGFEVGTVLKLQVFNTSFETLLPIEAKIVHQAQLPDGSWIMGAEFVNELKEEELEMLLE